MSLPAVVERDVIFSGEKHSLEGFFAFLCVNNPWTKVETESEIYDEPQN